MLMANQSVLAIYDNREKANQAITALLEAGVTPQCISVISRVEQLAPVPRADEENLAKDASLGAAAGGVVGLLTGAVVLVASGLAPFVVAGALVGALGGAATGSLVGLLAGYSVPEAQAAGYEDLINSGHVLVFVHGDPLQVAQSETVFETTPPHLLHLHAAAAPSESGSAVGSV